MNRGMRLPPLRTLLLALGASLAVAHAAPAGAEEIALRPPSRVDANHRASFGERWVDIARGGRSQAEIVIGKGDTDAARYAAKELQQHLQAIVGARIPLVERFSGARTSLVVGPGALARSLGADLGKLPRDAFVIRHYEQNEHDVIVIAGRDDRRWRRTIPGQKGSGLQPYERATLFAVYDFLERFAGVRFFFGDPLGTVIPKAATLRVPSMNIYEAPDFVMRRVSITRGRLPLDAPQTRDALVQRVHHELNTLRYETFSIPTTHGLSRTGLLERFGESHPEYFALRADGRRDLEHGADRPQLCLMNPGLRAEVLRDVASYLDGLPANERGILRRNKTAGYDVGAFAPGFVSVMPMDGLAPKNFCRDELCKRWRNAEGDHSNYVWGFVNAMARGLKAYGIRGSVTNIAYAGYRQVPDFPIEDNVVVQLALVGPWKEIDPAQREDDALIAQWDAKLGGRGDILLWNYINSRGERAPDGTPALAPRNIAAWYERNAKHLAGALLQSDTQYRLFNYINYYVFHRVAWDTETDVEALLQDHHEKMFGPAAGVMGAFFDRLEELWSTRGILQYRSSTRPRIITPMLSETWGDIYDEDELARFEALFDQAESLTIASPEHRRRVEYMRRNFLGEILRGRRDYYARQHRLADLTFPVLPADDATIVIDGQPNEAFWKDARRVELMAGEGGGDPEVATTVLAVWTPSHLLLAFEAREPRPRKMKRRASRNRVGLVLAVLDDRDTPDAAALSGTRQIWVDSKGKLIESATGPDGGALPGWRSGSQAAVATETLSWSAELQIPRRALTEHRADDGSSKLIANLARLRSLAGQPAVEQWSSWSPFVRRDPAEPRHFGTLELVQQLPKSLSLVANGGMEAAGATRKVPSSWSRAKGVVLDDSTFREGRRSLRLESSDFADIAVRQPLEGLRPGTRYALTFFVRAEGLETQSEQNYAGGYVNVMADYNRFYPYMRISSDIPWTKQVYEFTTEKKPAKQSRSFIKLGFHRTRGRIWFDDIRIRPIADPVGAGGADER